MKEIVKEMPKSDIQMKNKCKIKILKKQYEENTESSVNDNNASGSTHFTCSFNSIHTHTHTRDFIFHT